MNAIFGENVASEEHRGHSLDIISSSLRKIFKLGRACNVPWVQKEFYQPHMALLRAQKISGTQLLKQKKPQEKNVDEKLARLKNKEDAE